MCSSSIPDVTLINILSTALLLQLFKRMGLYLFLLKVDRCRLNLKKYWFRIAIINASLFYR